MISSEVKTRGAHGALGNNRASFLELDWKTPIFSGGAVRKIPNASHSEGGAAPDLLLGEELGVGVVLAPGQPAGGQVDEDVPERVQVAAPGPRAALSSGGGGCPCSRGDALWI